MKKLIGAVLLLGLLSSPVWAAGQIVKFAWTRSPEKIVTGYQLYRRTSPDDAYKPIGKVVPQVAAGVEPTTQDTIPYTAGVVYWYVITAKSNSLESGFSNNVNVSPLQIPDLRILVSVKVEVN